MKGIGKILKWSLLTLLSVGLLVMLFGVWFIHLLPEPTKSMEDLKTTQVSDIPFLTENVVPDRGRILAVVTSSDLMGTSGKSTGYELTELARAYYIFQANGFEVNIASPLGGNPPVVIDKDDMKEYSYAFLNDPLAQNKVSHSIPVKDVDPDDYEAIYFVGGKGAMFDFPGNQHIQAIVRDCYESGKVIGAVCHGPAALVNVTLSNGKTLLDGKNVSSFTNKEELLLISDAREIFPFLLQDKLIEKGANYQEGTMYLNKVSKDGNLITGQNPWSTWTVAEAIIEQLGYKPKPREITGEENAVQVLKLYETKGYTQAKSMYDELSFAKNMPIDRELLAVHSLLAAYRLHMIKAVNLIRLLRYGKAIDNKR
jgi:putative intracellular protease/amidase